MLQTIIERMRQGHRTQAFPAEPPRFPARFRGLPRVEPGRCPAKCRVCADVCPVKAITPAEHGPSIDLGLCLFCPACVAACPCQALFFTQEYRLAARNRDDLLLHAGAQLRRAEPLSGTLKSLFGRSFKLRQVSAGGCNACEADTNVLNTLAWDLGRFGIQFVASPRHADGVLVTGPVSENMREALLKTLEAVPEPRLVIAIGACAIGGGPFRDHAQVHNGADSLIPVDLYIPGCPPHPATIMDGLLRLIGRID